MGVGSGWSEGGRVCGGGGRVEGSVWGRGKGQREWLGVGKILVCCGRFSCFVREWECARLVEIRE